MQGRPQDLGGGGPRNFFFRFGNLHVAKRHAAHGEAMRIARGVTAINCLKPIESGQSWYVYIYINLVCYICI